MPKVWTVHAVNAATIETLRQQEKFSMAISVIDLLAYLRHRKCQLVEGLYFQQ